MLRILALGFVFCLSLACISQTSKYKFTHLSTSNGLSQSSVLAIQQDDLGQIWIGTRDGLSKYDGSTFKVYRNVVHDSSSISNNDILAIKQDSKGFIWVGTYNGLNRYNPKTNKFTRYFHEQNSNSLSNNTVWVIEELSNGEIWVGTSNGLSIYNHEKDSFDTHVKNASSYSLSGNHILSILETEKGDVFIGTSSGLSEWITKEKSNYQFKTIEGTETIYIQDIIESKEHAVLIATLSNGVLEYSKKNRSLTSYLKKGALNDDDKNVRRLMYDNSGQLWLGTYNGLKIVNNNSVIRHLRSDLDDPKSLSRNSVKSLFKDKKGSVWVGTYYGGVNIWDASNDNFLNFTRGSGNTGLGYNVISSVAYYESNVFFATEGGGISIYSKATGDFKYINKNNNNEIPDDNIKSLYVSDQAKLWVGSFNKGLAIYNLKTQKFENSFLPKLLTSYLKDVGVYAIKKDDHENIWLGTFGKGLVKYNLTSKSFSVISAGNDISKSLSSNLIRTVLIDRDENIWVGTEKGLNKVDKNALVTTYFYDMNRQYGEDILSIYEDSRRKLWVGTKAKGLFRLKENNFSTVPLTENNIVVSSVHSILEDDMRNLWVSTNQGIIRYDVETEKSDFFNKKDGLIGNEFNDNSSLKIGKSEFYFGGPSGVTCFDSNNLTKNIYAPQVILTDFALKNKPIVSFEDQGVLQKALPYTKSIRLAYNQGNFGISFAIPNFINSNNNSYKYRLKGLEKEWNFTSGNLASYTIQNPGDYIFEVIGANSDGVWNEAPTSINIRVAPAPWRSWWAFLLYGLFIATALYFLTDVLKSKTKLRHQLELEHIESERTKEINKTKLEFFTNISHEFRTPLALILGPLQQVIEDYQGSSKLYKKLLVIENSANHLLQLINRLMDFRKLENNLYKLETAEGNIVKFLQEIYLSFSEFAKDGGYDYQFLASEKEILVYYDRNKLERVFYNLISNAFRYTTKGGNIKVLVAREKENVLISIEDSGVGIAKEYQDKIFERFFEVAVNNKPDNEYNKGTGIGLSIAKNIVNLHKGEISVMSNSNDIGSKFIVEIPLGRGHLSEEEIIKDFKFSDDVSHYVEQLEPQLGIFTDEIPDIIDHDKQTVLLVEDNKPLRKFMKSVLEGGYNILEAENGKIALKIAKRESPDIIVSDVIMPVMTGTEFCAAIKEDLKTCHIPLILLTSRTSLIYKLEGLEKGADDYISKPFNVKEFKTRIKNLLESNKRLKERFANVGMLKPNEVTVTSIDEVLYKKAIRIVEEHIGNEQFDIPFFCSELGVSRTILFTKIKAWSNFTPNAFIQHFRLQRAAQLLEQGKINISEVSNKVGFKNPKYFSKCFHNKFGETPTQYANKFFDY